MDSPSKLSPEAHELLNFLEQYWYLYGQLPTKEKCVEKEACSAAVYDNWVPREIFREAMRRRDIPVPGESKNNGVLSEHQLIVANALFDTHDTRSQVKKLKELRCSPRTYQAWLRDPAYQEYIRTRSENLLGDNQHESHLALLDRVKSGDINAIKYYNEITGRYIPNNKDSVDVNAVLHRILEIIQIHVKDPAVLGAISQDMLAMSTNSADQARTSINARPIRVIESVPTVGVEDI